MAAEAYSAALFAIGAAAHSVLFVLLLLSGRANAVRAFLIGACASTSLASLGGAIGYDDVLGWSGSLIELATSGVWCAFVLYLLYKRGQAPSYILKFVSIIAFIIAFTSFGFGFVEFVPEHGARVTDPGTVLIGSRLGLAIIGLLATENLYRNTIPESRWHVNLLCVGLAGMFAYTIVFYADALLFRVPSELLWAGRGLVIAFAAPLFAVAAARNRDWAIDIHVSRAVVFHTTTLLGSGIFLLALAATGEVFRAIGPGWGDLAEMTLIIGGVAAIGIIGTSGSAQSRLRRILAENFFTHRYDYRKEWLKSIEILSAGLQPDNVQSRVIKAVAEVADSPGGVLWVRDIHGGGFDWAGSWNQPAVAAAEPGDSPFIALFRDGDWVIELDGCELRPSWLSRLVGAWIAVPLAVRGKLIGFVVLSPPRAPPKLDRETFDLLRIVARQSAIHIAEQLSSKALVDSQELRDFGKRFAFVAHDLKNVTGQLGMVLQNARHHADDPEFHQDVLATVRAALERIDRLLSTLRSRQEPDVGGLIIPIDLLREHVSSIRRTRGLSIEVSCDGQSAAVAMDSAAFRSVITHLCDNAIEASAGQVRIRVRHDEMRLQIDVTDHGNGMTPEFIRDKLFQPFGSTKRGGMGIGVYQARELIRAAGGDLLVSSRPGAGTTMSVVLPCVGRHLVAHIAPSGLERIQ